MSHFWSPCSHNINSCATGISIDKLFSDYSDIRLSIIKLLLNNKNRLISDLWGKYLNVDRQCCSSTGNLCTNCEVLRRFNITSNQPYIVKYGRCLGSEVILTEKNISPSLRFDRILSGIMKMTIKKTPNLLHCGSPNGENLDFLNCDSFTNEILIKWLYNNIIGEVFQNSPQLLYAFQCGKVGKMLEESSQRWARNENISMNVEDAVVQIAAILLELSGYDFVHGNPDIHSLRIKRSPISRIYEGVHIVGDYTLSLDMGGHSSMTIGGIQGLRIVSSPKPDINVDYQPQMERLTLVGNDSQVTIYTIDSGAVEILMAYRQSGIPIFPGNLEMYCYLISLMAIPSDYQIIREKYREIWNKLWINIYDKDVIEKRLEAWHSERNDYPLYHEILYLLSGLMLRCDSLSVVWKGLGGTIPSMCRV